MRAREILQEDYNQSLQSDLTDILVGAKGSGASQVNTAAVVNQLHQMGYAVSVDSILSLLNSNPAVSAATPEMINLTAADGSTSGSENPEDSADQVSDMAQNATDL
jgi:hypothetical protein